MVDEVAAEAVAKDEAKGEVAVVAVKVVVTIVLEEIVETEALTEEAVGDLTPAVRLCLFPTTLLSLLWAGSRLSLHHSDGQYLRSRHGAPKSANQPAAPISYSTSGIESTCLRHLCYTKMYHKQKQYNAFCHGHQTSSQFMLI